MQMIRQHRRKIIRHFRQIKRDALILQNVRYVKCAAGRTKNIQPGLTYYNVICLISFLQKRSDMHPVRKSENKICSECPHGIPFCIYLRGAQRVQSAVQKPYSIVMCDRQYRFPVPCFFDSYLISVVRLLQFFQYFGISFL